ncbi:MAG: DNA photolyase [Desulfobulbaceae bacterium]|nr:MAG: DNA photolyase [Desulfobulbaceae bacterium]
MTAQREKRSWRDPSKYLRHIHVEEGCVDLPVTREILERAQLPWSVVPERQAPDGLDGDCAANLSHGKQHLLLCRNRGQFFKPCPGTKEYRCCKYEVLSTGMNCPMDCAYCILQAYMNTPWITHYVNTGDLLAELDRVLDADPSRLHRIGTGEFTDSLALDRITGLSRILVEYFAGKPNAVLELKTKSAVVGNLASLAHRGRTVVAWSLNSPAVVRREELRSATLVERLEAAAQCAAWGYRLAFHFDPIIDYPGWQDGYRETIRLLFARVPAASIAWISLGALRYLPHLKEIGVERFPGSSIYFQEFVDGLDGKSRYYRKRRVGLYQYIYRQLMQCADPRTCIYFCMESSEVWQEVMGFDPEAEGGIAAMLDRTVFD